MKKILMILFILLTLVACNKQEEEKRFPLLNVISFEELDVLIEEGYTGVIYFGWVDHCGDSHNIQDNYFEGKLKENPEWMDKIYVVNLDLEIPEALSNKDLRLPMTEKYNVQYSPTLIYYVNGEIDLLVEWTPLTGDSKTAIAVEVLEAFFVDAGF